ncbi:polysaccharide export protein [Psychromonas sp. CNPT3]|uniref:XrtA/PEP-CTERM system exopolysaccharide export protein n=1 Tax=Psychromonas sp. CNPT3 TaxID=314282 RepID=UPI00006E9CB9|nr:XrtA/PEP-CTERM system exopolysaccharide export protein [Psychromonas sp. CNPT3]AGH80207.1 polysaccharide export protein [Psychromonas sp. CNPT3]
MKNTFLLLLFTLVSACSAPLEIPEPGIAVSEYKIGIDDQLFINVWKNPDISLNALVRPDGMISVPLIGDIQAASLSSEVLAENITKALSKYIRTPEVTVILTASQSANYLNRLRITGAINAPQSRPYQRGMTVLDLVLEAGSLTDFADGDATILYRKTADGIKRYSIQLDQIIKKGDISTNYELQPADILIIPESLF